MYQITEAMKATIMPGAWPSFQASEATVEKGPKNRCSSKARLRHRAKRTYGIPKYRRTAPSVIRPLSSVVWLLPSPLPSLPSPLSSLRPSGRNENSPRFQSWVPHSKPTSPVRDYRRRPCPALRKWALSSLPIRLFYRKAVIFRRPIGPP